MPSNPHEINPDAVPRISKPLLAGIGMMVLVAVLFVTQRLVGAPPYGSGFAEHVVLVDTACTELRNAKTLDGKKAPEQAFPCAFTGYLYPTQIAGLLAVDGVSENVKGRCLTLAAAIIDTKRSYVDSDYPRQPDMPARVLEACKGRLP
ncbi:MAG: hypothetical protein BGO50_01750 [Rhodanobacter sp. 67-28]|nr:MAG: hypothetical protein BGO50_01750 [Rhodanobacter sp. 67-28]